MAISITCSCCGKHEDITKKNVSELESILAGWGSYGSALYCPDCTTTWKERNGDKPMAAQSHTFFLVLLEACCQATCSRGR